MIRLAYASFGREPPQLSGGTKAGVWLLCALFVVWGLATAAVLNAVALLGGTTVRFIGRNGVEYRFFRLFGKVRAIIVATPVLFCFFAWQEMKVTGFLGAIWPIFAILALAAVSLALCAWVGQRNAPS